LLYKERTILDYLYIQEKTAKHRLVGGFTFSKLHPSLFGSHLSYFIGSVSMGVQTFHGYGAEPIHFHIVSWPFVEMCFTVFAQKKTLCGTLSMWFHSSFMIRLTANQSNIFVRQPLRAFQRFMLHLLFLVNYPAVRSLLTYLFVRMIATTFVLYPCMFIMVGGARGVGRDRTRHYFSIVSAKHKGPPLFYYIFRFSLQSTSPSKFS